MDYSKIPSRLKVESVDKTKYLTESNENYMVYTPKNIVDDMIELLPQELWNNPDIKFLDICCKSGIFLDRLFWKLDNGLSNIIPNKIERSDHILTKQLFGLAPNQNCAEDARSVLYGTYKANHNNSFTRQFEDEYGNIKVLTKVLKNTTLYFDEIIKNKDLFENTVREVLGDIEFEFTVGNPLYNKGIDLDFVNLGFGLCKKACLMITPAKWQTAESNQRVVSKTMNYGQFRDKLVPHMSKVVFYPDCKDVFDIYQTDGITYYLLDKVNKVDKCSIVNISKTRGNIYNSNNIRSISNEESLLNIGNGIIESIEPYNKFKFQEIYNNKQFKVVTNTKVSGYDWFTEYGPRYALGISRILNVSAGDTYAGESKDIFESDDIGECKSFVSWLNTRFTRFFLVPNISKLNGILSDHYFRFVPAPPSGKFDHIYTDVELYKAFNLSQKYIDIIEAVIKERK